VPTRRFRVQHLLDASSQPTTATMGWIMRAEGPAARSLAVPDVAHIVTMGKMLSVVATDFNALHATEFGRISQHFCTQTLVHLLIR